MRTRWVGHAVLVCGLMGGLVGGCGARAVVADWVELAPGLRVDASAGAVEFDGEIAVDVHHPDTPVVWLELFVTGPDSREHESLVVTRVRPSLIHAAMLAAGFEAGTPGEIVMNAEGELERRAATGTRARVEFVLVDPDGAESSYDPSAWVVHEQTGELLAENEGWDGFVFAGSREASRQGHAGYDADGTGVVVGLSTFGSEVIAPVMVMSHRSAVDEAVWIAKNEMVPPIGTVVRVRVWVEK